MSKQSKITVKQYLEKKVNPIYRESEKEDSYPLYYRITYKRKTTNLRSFTGYYLTEKSLKNLIENNQNTSHFLGNELKYIEIALQDIIKKNPDIEVFDNALMLKLKIYFENLNNGLLYQGWKNYKLFIDNNTRDKEENDKLFDEKYSKLKDEKAFYQNQFYGVFNRERTLLANLFYIKKIAGVDLEPFIYKETIKFWQVINLIISTYSETNIFIDFFVNYDLNRLIESNKKHNYNISKIEIENISKELIKKHLSKHEKEKN